jgi:hypothetical protein
MPNEPAILLSPKPHRRFVIEDQPLTEQEALKDRLESLRWKLLELSEQVDEIYEVFQKPLPTSKQVHVAVRPDDPRYESAPYEETIEFSKMVCQTNQP